MKNISNNLGNRIRQFRKLKGLTQEKLALNSGITVSFLGDVERGNKKPSVESLEKLLSVLDITFQEFFDFESEIKPHKNCIVLEKLNLALRNRSEDEIKMVYGIVKQLLAFNDKK